jgi:hypothetical protein
MPSQQPPGPVAARRPPSRFHVGERCAHTRRDRPGLRRTNRYVRRPLRPGKRPAGSERPAAGDSTAELDSARADDRSRRLSIAGRPRVSERFSRPSRRADEQWGVQQPAGRRLGVPGLASPVLRSVARARVPLSTRRRRSFVRRPGCFERGPGALAGGRPPFRPRRRRQRAQLRRWLLVPAAPKS